MVTLVPANNCAMKYTMACMNAIASKVMNSIKTVIAVKVRFMFGFYLYTIFLYIFYREHVLFYLCKKQTKKMSLYRFCAKKKISITKYKL